MKKVKMVFKEDKFVNNEIFAEANKPVMVDEVSVDRWIKRGGSIVGDKAAELAEEQTDTPPELNPEVNLDEDTGTEDSKETSLKSNSKNSNKKNKK